MYIAGNRIDFLHKTSHLFKKSAKISLKKNLDRFNDSFYSESDHYHRMIALIVADTPVEHKIHNHSILHHETNSPSIAPRGLPEPL